MIKVICRKCGTHLNARDTSAGHRAPCPTCGTLLRVPAPPASAPAAGAAAAPRPAPAGKPAAAGEPAAAPDTAPAAPPTGQPASHGGLAIAGFACGIASAVLVLVPCIGLLAVPVALAGLVLSVIALITAKKAGRKKGLAVAGLVLSLLVPVLYVIMISVIAGLLGTAASTLPLTGPPAEPSAPSASLAQVGPQRVGKSPSPAGNWRVGDKAAAKGILVLTADGKVLDAMDKPLGTWRQEGNAVEMLKTKYILSDDGRRLEWPTASDLSLVRLTDTPQTVASIAPPMPVYGPPWSQYTAQPCYGGEWQYDDGAMVLAQGPDGSVSGAHWRGKGAGQVRDSTLTMQWHWFEGDRVAEYRQEPDSPKFAKGVWRGPNDPAGAKGHEDGILRVKPAAQACLLVLRTTPPGCDVTLNGVKVRNTPNLANQSCIRMYMLPGKLSVKAERQGFAPSQQDIVLEPGQKELTVALQPAK